MKNLVIFCIALLLATSIFSCSSRSPRHNDLKKVSGIEKLSYVDSKYWVITFNDKCSSAELFEYMKKENLVVIKIVELNAILSQLDSRANKHASIYGMNEFSKETTQILRKIFLTMPMVRASEVYSPIFHQRKNGVMFADWGDFQAGWSKMGYMVVARNIATKK